MWHPIATSQHRPHAADEGVLLHTIEEEPRSPTQAMMVNAWKPLELSPIEHAQHKPDRPREPTPFDADLPTKVPEVYYGLTNAGLQYVLYSLAHLSRDDVSDLLQRIKFHADEELEADTLKVKRAPIYDFCSDKTLRDIYEYHTSLLNDGNHGVAHGRFVVAASSDWEAHGVMVVDFDCRPNDRGRIGILRVHVSELPRCLRLLETSNRNWTDLKAAELDRKWPAHIAGYSGTKWQTFGYGYYSDRWLKGDYMSQT